MHVRLALAAVVILGTVSCARAADPVETELARLTAAAQSIDPATLHEQVRDLIPTALARIKHAEATKDPLLRLYRLRDAQILTETVAFVAAHPAETKSLEAFAALWEAEKVHFASTPSRRPPNFVRSALLESAHNRAGRLFKASLPYARVSSPFSGVYYLGEAVANRRFGEFLETLPVAESAPPEPRPTPEALRAAANALEEETLRFFATDLTSRTAIPTSAKLKETTEMIRAGAIDGATLTLLETRLELSRRQTRPSGADTSPPAPGDSMAALWQSIASADREGPTRQLIHHSVLPLYDNLMRNRL